MLDCVFFQRERYRSFVAHVDVCGIRTRCVGRDGSVEVTRREDLSDNFSRRTESGYAAMANAIVDAVEDPARHISGQRMREPRGD